MTQSALRESGGREEAAFSLHDKYTVESGQIYLSGLQALVRLPLDQRRSDRRDGVASAAFISGYEGSPLAGYDLELTRQNDLLDEHGVIFKPGLNEELAINAVQGAQLASLADDKRFDGVAGYWYGKAPGLDRASDALRHANLGGTSSAGGVLAIVGDDALAKSSTVPSSSEIAMAELGMPVLVPADPQDILDLGRHGIEMSRFCGLWVGLKIATNVADGAATAEVGPNRIKHVLPDHHVDGKPFKHQVSAQFLQPKLVELETTLMHQRLELARRYAAANGLNVIDGGEGDRIGIVAAGGTYLDVRQALDLLGLAPAAARERGIRVLKLGMVSPLDSATIEEFAAGLEEIIVVEEKRPFIETAIKDMLYGRPHAPIVTGKRDPDGEIVFRAVADLGADLIAKGLAGRLSAHQDIPSVATYLATRVASQKLVRTLLPLTPRTPFFCSGCPHNRSTEVPDGALVGAGIGCSGIAMIMPADRVGDIVGLTQMGGEGAGWIGMAPFIETRHMFQNIGDGTFHHSGSLAVRAAVAAGSNITFKLLYNSAVAMTGGQEAVGNMTVADLTRMLSAEGVRKIVVTTEEPRRYKGVKLAASVDVRHRDELIRTQEELAGIAGVTVLIHDQECATELRRKRKRGQAAEPPHRAFINERVCEGCGDCGKKSNCLSVRPVDTEFGRKTEIHQSSCNKDFSCLDGDCPSFLTVVPSKTKTAKRAAVPEMDGRLLPEPTWRCDPDRFSARIAGIGGTGVVTVAQIISTAAAIAGYRVRALDQTGLAQKGGAVISDVKVMSSAQELANKLSAGECDLYVGCDVLVAAAASNLEVADPGRTVAVVSSSEVPTGAMIVDTSVAFPSAQDTLGRIAERTRGGAGRIVDAHTLTKALFDDEQYSNVFLIGVAYQVGSIPIAAEHIERAIGLNGVAVEANRQAFRRGRQLVADQEGLRAAIEGLNAPAAGAAAIAVTSRISSRLASLGNSMLGSLVQRRVMELTAYQNEAYAARYVDFVEHVRDAEARLVPGSTALAEAVAVHLHKLMAYKDEYEVARLSIDPTLTAEIERQFGKGAKYFYRLHPPLLRALGMKKKISLGGWIRVVFRLLHLMRRVRGTWLDPFGYGTVRRTERALIGEYRDVVETLLDRLTPDTQADILRIAELPDLVRGYEQIKLTNVDAFRGAVKSGLEALEAGAA